MQLKKWAATSLLLMMSACATVEAYQSASPASGATSSLSFVRGARDGFGYSSLQDLLISDTGRCEDLKLAANIVWTTPKEKSVVVYSDRQLTILASTLWVVSTGYAQTSMPTCHKYAKFTPKSGASYVIKLASPLAQDCILSVIDNTTGIPPSDLLVQDGATCLRDFRRAMEIKE
jgi:hypothetical protein